MQLAGQAAPGPTELPGIMNIQRFLKTGAQILQAGGLKLAL